MLVRVADYFERCADEQRSVLLLFRECILNASVHIEEKWRFNTPFYDYYGMCFYLGKTKKDECEIGFIDGFLLSNDQGLLTSFHLKMVRHYRVKSQNEVNTAALNALIQEALLIREEKNRSKKKKVIT
jgi:hypothetical protein